MKWKIKKNEEPHKGSERWNKRFAWFPVRVRDLYNNEKHLIWLENYKQKQRYASSYDVVSGVDVMRWITIGNFI